MNQRVLLMAGIALCGLPNPSISTMAIETNPLEVEWAQSFGGTEFDGFGSLTETTDRGFISIGNTTSTNAGFVNKGTYDGFIVKYDEAGVSQWVRSFGGAKQDFLYDVTTTADGGAIIVGDSPSTDAGFVNKGREDAIFMKYKNNGDLEWLRSWGGAGDESFKSVTKTSDGGFICAGYSSSSDLGLPANGSYDAIIVKFDSNGEEQWRNLWGGSVEDIFYSVEETSDGGFVAVGESGSPNTEVENKGGRDALIIKYSKDGSQQWVKSFGGNSYDSVYSVIETTSGDFIVAGQSDSTDAGFENQGGRDLVLAKYNKNGEHQWLKSWGGDGSDQFRNMIKTPDNGFIVSGGSNSTSLDIENKGGLDVVLLKYDESGLLQWVQSWGGNGNESALNIIKTSDGDIVISGNSGSKNIGLTNRGDNDAIIVKFKGAFNLNDANLQVTGSFTPVMASVTIPTSEVLFTLDPNREAGQQFIAPEFELINNSNGPIRLSIHNFEQKTSILNDVLPSQHLDWTTLNKEQSKDIALAITPQPSDGWVSLLEGPRYVVEPSNYDLGIIKPGSTVSFQLEAIHGLAFSEPLFPQYELSFVFDLK